MLHIFSVVPKIKSAVTSCHSVRGPRMQNHRVWFFSAKNVCKSSQCKERWDYKCSPFDVVRWFNNTNRMVLSSLSSLLMQLFFFFQQKGDVKAGRRAATLSILHIDTTPPPPFSAWMGICLMFPLPLLLGLLASLTVSNKYTLDKFWTRIFFIKWNFVPGKLQLERACSQSTNHSRLVCAAFILWTYIAWIILCCHA